MVTIMLLIIQGLRDNTVGGDTYNYLVHYRMSNELSFGKMYDTYYFEVGYQILVSTLSKIGLPFQAFLFLVSAFNLTVFGLMTYQFSINPLVSYIFFYILGIYDFGFSGLRQSISMSLMLIAMYYVFKRKKGMYIFYVLLAGTFHTSALFFILLIPFFEYKKVMRIYYKLYVPIVLALVLFGEKITEIVFSFYRSGVYTQSLNFLDSYFLGIGNDELLIVIITFLGFIIYKSGDLPIKMHNYNVLYFILTLSLILQLLSPYNYFFSRFNLFLLQIVTLFIPVVLRYLFHKISFSNLYVRYVVNTIAMFLLIIFAINFYDNYLDSNPHMILPHYFFWE